MPVSRVVGGGALLVAILMGSFTAASAATLPPVRTATATTAPPTTSWVSTPVDFAGVDPFTGSGFLPTIVEGPDGEPWYLVPSVGLYSAWAAQPPVLHTFSIPVPAGHQHVEQPTFGNLAAAPDHSLWFTAKRTAADKAGEGEIDTYVAHVTANGISTFQIDSAPYSATVTSTYWYMSLNALPDGSAEVFRYDAQRAWQAIHVTTAGVVTTTDETVGLPPNSLPSAGYQGRPDNGYFWSFDPTSDGSPKIQRLSLDGSLTQFPAPAGAESSWPYGGTQFTRAADGVELFSYAIDGTPHTGRINADGSVSADASEPWITDGTWTTGSTTNGLILHRVSNPAFSATLPAGYSEVRSIVWPTTSNTGWLLVERPGGSEELLQISSTGSISARTSPEYVDNLRIADDGTVWAWYSQGFNFEVVGPGDGKITVVDPPDFYTLDFTNGQTAWYFTHGIISPQLKLVEVDPRNTLSAPVFGIGDATGDGKPDFVARRPDGTLWLYAGTGKVNSSDHGYQPAVKIGTGWNLYNSIIGVGDLDGDGYPDLVARKPDGTLWFAAGKPGDAGAPPSFATAKQIGTGWSTYTELVAAGDFNGDGHPDVLARKADGSLWFAAGTTSGTLDEAVKIGSSGWNSYRQLIGIGDLNRDGKADLVGERADGSMWFYAGTGIVSDTSSGYLPATPLDAAQVPSLSDKLAAVGDLNSDGIPDMLDVTTAGALQFIAGASTPQTGYAAAKEIGTSGWNIFKQTAGVGDFNGDGKNDLIGSRADGTLWFYAGTGSVGTSDGYAAGRRIGTNGWNSYKTLIGTGDLNGDGPADLLGIRANGELWFYSGTGKVGSGDTGYGAGALVGTGWGVYTSLVAGDFNGDHKADLLGTRSDGSLWFYAGTGKVGAGDTGYQPGKRVGSGWSAYSQFVTGDFNGDGRTDLAARSTDGSLWFWPGSAGADATTSGLGNKVLIGGGWNVYRSLIGTGDFNGDDIPDFAGIRADGTLWFYAGSGMAGMPGPSLAAPALEGTGWKVYG